MPRTIIGIMGAGKGATPGDLENARALGEAVAQRGWVVLTGGRDAGVMSAACEGAHRVKGSLTIGILPSAGDVSPHVDLAIVTGLGQARNNVNILSSRVVVACGNGGAGTVSEVALAIKAWKPVVIVGADEQTNAFYSRLGGDLVRIAAGVASAMHEIEKIVGR